MLAALFFFEQSRRGVIAAHHNHKQKETLKDNIVLLSGPLTEEEKTEIWLNIFNRVGLIANLSDGHKQLIRKAFLNPDFSSLTFKEDQFEDLKAVKYAIKELLSINFVELSLEALRTGSFLNKILIIKRGSVRTPGISTPSSTLGMIALELEAYLQCYPSTKLSFTCADRLITNSSFSDFTKQQSRDFPGISALLDTAGLVMEKDQLSSSLGNRL